MKIRNRKILLSFAAFVLCLGEGQSKEISAESGGNSQLELTVGGIGTGGGDEKAARAYSSLIANMSPEERVSYFRKLVYDHGVRGLKQIRQLVFLNYKFKDKDGTPVDVTPEKLDLAFSLLADIYSGSNKKFRLNPKLINPADGEPRFASNSADGEFIFNSMEWIALEYKYTAALADQMRSMYVVHEVFSQPNIGLERTGNFVVSSVLLDTETLKSADAQIEDFKGVFPESDLKLLYSCEAEFWKELKGESVRVWKSPYPLRTYLKWAIGDTDIWMKDGKKMLMNPNWVPGAGGICYSFGMKTLLGDNAPIRELIYRESKSSALEICYVMSDASKDEIGSIDFVIRRVNLADENGWNKINYITKRGAKNATIRGKGETEFQFEDYKLKMRCDRATKI